MKEHSPSPLALLYRDHLAPKSYVDFVGQTRWSRTFLRCNRRGVMWGYIPMAIFSPLKLNAALERSAIPLVEASLSVYMSRHDWIHSLAWIALLEDNSAYYIFQNPMSPIPCSGKVAVTELSGLL